MALGHGANIVRDGLVCILMLQIQSRILELVLFGLI
jgi:hypothetical protein